MANQRKYKEGGTTENVYLSNLIRKYITSKSLVTGKSFSEYINHYIEKGIKSTDGIDLND